MTKKSKHSGFHLRLLDYKVQYELDISWRWYLMNQNAVSSPEEDLFYTIISKMKARHVFNDITLRNLAYKYFDVRKV